MKEENVISDSVQHQNELVDASNQLQSSSAFAAQSRSNKSSSAGTVEENDENSIRGTEYIRKRMEAQANAVQQE